jgi:hypothetical protein
MIIFGVEVKGDHTFDRESMERYMAQAYKAGQEDERAEIVALLRDETQIMAATVQAQNMLLEAAAKIEAGEHQK